MVLTVGEVLVTVSYIESMDSALPALLDCSRVALIFALFLLRTIIIVTTLTIKAVARKPIDTVYTILMLRFSV